VHTNDPRVVTGSAIRNSSGLRVGAVISSEWSPRPTRLRGRFRNAILCTSSSKTGFGNVHPRHVVVDKSLDRTLAETTNSVHVTSASRRGLCRINTFFNARSSICKCSPKHTNGPPTITELSPSSTETSTSTTTTTTSTSTTSPKQRAEAIAAALEAKAAASRGAERDALGKEAAKFWLEAIQAENTPQTQPSPWSAFLPVARYERAALLPEADKAYAKAVETADVRDALDGLETELRKSPRVKNYEQLQQLHNVLNHRSSADIGWYRRFTEFGNRIQRRLVDFVKGYGGFMILVSLLARLAWNWWRRRTRRAPKIVLGKFGGEGGTLFGALVASEYQNLTVSDRAGRLGPPLTSGWDTPAMLGPAGDAGKLVAMVAKAVDQIAHYRLELRGEFDASTNSSVVTLAWASGHVLETETIRAFVLPVSSSPPKSSPSSSTPWGTVESAEFKQRVLAAQVASWTICHLPHLAHGIRKQLHPIASRRYWEIPARIRVARITRNIEQGHVSQTLLEEALSIYPDDATLLLNSPLEAKQKLSTNEPWQEPKRP
jgi:hypothetical protein